MSDTEGEVNADPFSGWVIDGDLVEDDCDALVSKSPFPSVCPCLVSLEPFRWNKRISEDDQALRCEFFGWPQLVTTYKGPTPGLAAMGTSHRRERQVEGLRPWLGLDLTNSGSNFIQ